MTTSHTPGRLRIKPAEQTAGWGLCIGTEGWIVARIPGREKTKAEANARRLVACWNFCLDMQTETLEAMTSTAYQMLMQKAAEKQELLEALKEFSEYVRNEQASTDGAVVYSNTQITRLAFKARAAIQKAEGKA